MTLRYLAQPADRPNLHGWPIHAYGASYEVIGAGWHTTGRHYLTQAAALLGAGAVTSYAVGGRRILDVCATLINGTALPGTTGIIAAGEWPGTSSRSGLCVLGPVINDIGHYPTMVGTATPAKITAANTRYLDSVKAMYRTALALMSSETRLDQGAATFDGTWDQTNQVSPPSAQSTIAYTGTVGAGVSWTGVTPPQYGPLAGKVFLLTYSLDPGIAGVASAINVSVDGGAETPTAVSAWEAYIGHDGTSAYQVPLVVAATLPVDGAAHSVRFEHAGSGGTYMYADELLVPSSEPNPIAVMGAEHPLTTGVWDATALGAYRYNVPLVLAAVKAATAEFGNALYVPSTMTLAGLYSDGVHPDDTGMTQHANDLVAALGNIRPRLDNRVL